MKPFSGVLAWKRLLAVGALTLSVAFMPSPAARAEDDLVMPLWKIHGNVVDGLLSSGEGASYGQYKNPPSPVCSNATSPDANVNTDCEGDSPHNETTIAVNPTNPLNMIGSANDYQLSLSPGGAVQLSVLSRAHVTFDGGRTWTTYPVTFHGPNFTGDPSVAFDADGRAYLTTLGFVVPQGQGCCVNPDIMVATSTDGGRNWTNSVRIASGTGVFGGPGKLLDKEWVAAWGHGNAVVTWGQFNRGQKGSYLSSPIMASVTHDGGQTWSAPTEISGSAPFCLGASGSPNDHNCNTSYVSVPTVAADGSIYVAILPLESWTTFRDQYAVVKLDPATGQRVGGPWKVANVIDGATDYPFNANGYQTHQDSQFRSWAAGNIAADPTSPGHLAVVWTDMRNSVLPAPADPYVARTNSDVIVSQSMDGGMTWSAPVAIPAAGDQFMPWGAYDAAGRLRIGYFDRSYDPANHRYGYSLATEVAPRALAFTVSAVTTALSDPTRDDRWFAVTINPAFPRATSFLGDYSNIAVIPGGGVAALWTDMRLQSCFGGRCAWAEDAFFGRAP